MSAPNREQVYAALFSFVQNALTGSPTPAVTVSRVPQHYANVSVDLMPAVYQVQKGEAVVRKRGLNAKYEFTSELLIYAVGTQDGVTPASTAINNILDTIDTALSPTPVPDNTQHLGLFGIVEHAWIEGKVEIYEAILNQISVAIVPIHILCTG